MRARLGLLRARAAGHAAPPPGPEAVPAPGTSPTDYPLEHRPALHEVAERNLAAFESKGGATCEVTPHCADALEVPLPAGPLVVFLFDPFGGPVLMQVLKRLVGREGWLLYVNPQHHTSSPSSGSRPSTPRTSPTRTAGARCSTAWRSSDVSPVPCSRPWRPTTIAGG